MGNTRVHHIVLAGSGGDKRALSEQPAGAQIGHHIAAAGDVGRDGVEDVIAGAPCYQNVIGAGSVRTCSTTRCSRNGCTVNDGVLVMNA